MTLNLKKKKVDKLYVCVSYLDSQVESKKFFLNCISLRQHTFNRMHTVITGDKDISPARTQLVHLFS